MMKILQWIWTRNAMIVCLSMVTVSVAATATTGPNAVLRKRSDLEQKDDRDATRNLIVNGDSAITQDYQFFVRSWRDSVLATSDFLCGASLIHPDIILTAAHCHGAFNYGVMMYNPSTKTFNRFATVDRQVAYPEYYQNINLINYDVMVLRLSTPVTDVTPVKINSDPNVPLPGRAEAHAAGFGVSSLSGTLPPDLQVGYFSPITNSQCRSRGNFVNVNIYGEDVMCVDPMDDDSVCVGDSGGPLTVQEDGAHVQVGVISFGTDCQADYVPDGVARVSYFHDWILQQICELSQVPPINCPSNLIDSNGSVESFLYEDAVQVRLDFHHDFLAEQTTYTVRNTLTNKIEYAGPQYVPRRGEQWSSSFKLFPGNYALEVYDAAGDGMYNPDYVHETYPSGSWRLYAEYSNGVLVELATGDEQFESIQRTQFRVPEDTSQVPEGAISLTDNPTQSPTSAPSVSASSQPENLGVNNEQQQSTGTSSPAEPFPAPTSTSSPSSFGKGTVDDHSPGSEVFDSFVEHSSGVASHHTIMTTKSTLLMSLLCSGLLILIR